MQRLLIPILFATILSAGCATLRPSNEAARYMVRGAALNKAATDGTYILTPGTDLPAVLSADLKAGDPVGFRLVETSNGQQLYAVAGTDDSYLLDRAQRYTWTRTNAGAVVNGVLNSGALDEQIRITERARDDARRQVDNAAKNLESAERRLAEVKARQAGMKK